ncbi:tyrosine-type recombinase/integrase [uncultured Sphingomonas sp.]|uniref:site-specific integrase n=1 Tax=uncultured Sphingomonas sp. TaxID=158754 RepID=UPI0025E64E7C|nr:tyrosine-type recombinase/integrase [uncultured Sphingomonas sp.]
MGQTDFRVMLPRVQRIRKGNRVLCYHRPTRARLPDLPEMHPEFIAAWAAAEALAGPARAKAVPGTVDAAVIAALGSRRFKGASSGYRATIQRGLEAIRSSFTGLPMTGLRRHHIAADIAPLDPNPANARLKAWRVLCAVALADGVLRDDPSQGVKKIAVSSDGHTRWSDDDIEAFRTKWKIGTSTRACFELVLWTGARTIDAVKLGRQNLDRDGLLVYRQSKTRNPAHVPWTTPLPDFAADWAADRDMMHRSLECLSGGLTFLEARGKVRSVKGLGNIINDGARDAGLTNRTAHGLRKARLSKIAESGGSTHAIMAWGGHVTLEEVELYTRAAALKRLVVGQEREQNAVNAPDMAVNGK